MIWARSQSQKYNAVVLDCGPASIAFHGVGTPSQLVLWLLLRSHGIKDIVLMRGQSEKQKEHWVFQNRGDAVQRMGYIDVEG